MSGRLALVLHSHMPYVEGFGTWPFGEEWLFEAMATSYLPLAAVLPERGVTVSATPVLADQLEAPGVAERFLDFLQDVRAASHALDAEEARGRGAEGEARALERAAEDYTRAAERFAALGPGGLLEALAPAWTSSATHAILPLCATDAGIKLQLRVGIEAHRARSGGHWDGGFWLPECAYAPRLDPLLEQAGVRTVCVDLTDVLGRGSPEHLRPRRTADGPVLVPLDRETMELVWSPQGYPCQAAYREYHRRSPRDHHPWAVDGAVYDADRAREQCVTDARDFVARVAVRLRAGGLCVCALDTELLGHWWYEGPWWLVEVVAECRRQGVSLEPLDSAVAAADVAAPIAPARLGTTTWGQPRTLATWDHPGVAELAWRTRAAELAVVAAGSHPPARAVRELLALQSSDWAFLITTGLAGSYPAERAAAHHAALRAALDAGARRAATPAAGGQSAAAPAAGLAGRGADDRLRNLAPHAGPASLVLS